MRTPEQVLDMARTRYRKSWRDWLSHSTEAELSFPLAAPSAQAIARESDAVGRWARDWRSWAEAHPTARLRRTTRRTIVGDQEVFTHLDLATTDDLVKLDQELSEHWQRATERWARIRTLPETVPEERLRPWLNQIIALDDADFEILLGTAAWFTQNPRSGHTVRQVPVVGMHTKWLARHRRLVLACLDLADRAAPDSTAEDGELEQSDLDVLGLKALPVHIDVILADQDDRARMGGLRHLRAPLPEIAALPLQPDLVMIVENKESAYLIPDRPRTVVIHSLGNHLNVLDEIDWLNCARHLYWGDLDRAGLTLLSRTRARLPQTVSALMDTETLEQHLSLAIIDKTRADTPETNLTPEELATLTALTTSDGHHLRLEQERIPESYFLKRLARAADGMSE
jgi:hypothetical protein